MRYCSNCGSEIPHGSRFCPQCGTPIPPEDRDIFTEFNTDDTTNQFSSEDIRQNKGFAVLSYIGLLVLIPIFGASRSPFARFHANQGVVLLIFNVAYSIARAIAMGIMRALLYHEYFIPGKIIFHITNGATGLVQVLFVVWMVIGIVNAAKGRARELPIIGRIHILK